MAIKRNVGIGLVVASVCLIVFVAAAVVLAPTYLKPTVDVNIGNGVFKARIAKTQIERDNLMSEVSNVTGSNALLFAYPNEDKWPIDISSVKEPVDVIWMNTEKKVMTIYRNASSESIKSGKITSSAMVKYVLIVPASSINLMAIGTGKVATFQVNVDEIK